MIIIIIVEMNESTFELQTKLNEVNEASKWLHAIYMEARLSSAALPIVAVCLGLEPDEWMKLCCKLPTVSEKNMK